MCTWYLQNFLIFDKKLRFLKFLVFFYFYFFKLFCITRPLVKIAVRKAARKIPTETTIHSSPLVLFAPMENPATSDQDRVLRTHLEVTQPNRVQTVSNARLGNTLMILKVRIPRHWFVKIVLYRLLQVLEILNAQIVQTGKKLLSRERLLVPLAL